MRDNSSPIVIHEGTLIDICDLLAADRFDLVDARVTWYKPLATGTVAQWTGFFGDQIVFDGAAWCISTELVVETTRAPVA